MHFLSRSARYPRLSLWGAALAAALTAPLPGHASETNPKPGAVVAQMVAIPESQHDAIKRAAKIRRLAANQPLSALVCFQFADPQAAQDYADAVSDPNSLIYGQWLTPIEIGQRFGPNQADYDAMMKHCQANGLQVVDTPVNRMTIRVNGTVAQMEKAFGVQMNEYKESAADAALRGPDGVPYTFIGSATPVQIPAALAGKITSIEGLETYARPIPRFSKLKHTISGPFDAVVARNAYNLKPIYDILNATANNKPGTGRTVGISNWDGTNPGTTTSGNALNFINRNALPFPSAGKVTNIQRVTITSSSGTSGQGEGDLDYQMTLGQAPLATIIIYDNGANDLVGVLNKELSDNKADVISESYGWNVSGSTLSSAHTAHVNMTNQGITYLAASGDSGNIANSVYQYPDYDPEVLNIGGTTLVANNSPAFTFFSETGWNGSGGGTSTSAAAFNKLPTWQVGRNVSVTNKRNVPDIASHSSASNGAYYFYYGSTLQTGAVGTSFASPVDAGDFAVVEQYMISQGGLPANGAGKQRLGRVATALYAFNGRNDVYHDTTSGNNGFAAAKYWDYVTGWGSVDWSNLAAALLNPLSVSVSPASASLSQGDTVSLAATVVGSNVTTVTWAVTSGPGTVSASGLYTAPASVTSAQTVTVTATSTIDTANPGTTGTAVRPNPVFGTATITLRPSTTVSGIVLLDSILDPTLTVVPVGAVTFVFTPTAGGSPITVNQTLGAGGTFSIPNIPGASYNLNVRGSKWLGVTQTVDASGGNVSGLTYSLPGGDANGDNMVDVTDFGIFVNTYSSLSPNGDYDSRADFNCDGSVDVGDFGIIVNNYNAVGQ